MENKKLNDSIISIRVKLQNAKLKKSGKNKFAGFDYFELADFLPKLNELMLEEGINDLFSIYNDGNGFNSASLVLIKGDEKQEYTMPFVLFETPVNIKYDKETGETREVKSMQDIQYLGALNTYYKRYLYLNAFGITDGEVIDRMNNDEFTNSKSTKKSTVKTASPKQISLLLQYYKGENLEKLLNANDIGRIEDLPMTKANEIIGKLYENKGDNQNGK